MTESTHAKYVLSLTGSTGFCNIAPVVCIFLSALSHSRCPGAAAVHTVTSALIASVTPLQKKTKTNLRRPQPLSFGPFTSPPQPNCFSRSARWDQLRALWRQVAIYSTTWRQISNSQRFHSAQPFPRNPHRFPPLYQSLSPPYLR